MTVRNVRGKNNTKNPRTVRKIHGTNRPWYETSTNGTKRLRYEKSMVWKVWHSSTACNVVHGRCISTADIKRWV